MNYKDYKRLKICNMMSVGKFSDRLYAMEFLTGAVCVPEYQKKNLRKDFALKVILFIQKY